MITEGFADFQGYKLWYRAVRPPGTEAVVPLLLLHGGPGGTSDMFEPLEALAQEGRPVIRFDQLGCGRSDRPRDVALWMIASCLQQIEAIRTTLALGTIHLLGHSWGGLLALEYLLTRPAGVRSVCLSSSMVSSQLWVAEALRLRSQMPAHLVQALARCEAAHQPRPTPPPGAAPAPTLTQANIEAQAKSMQSALPVISHPLTANIAAWLSHVPFLRRAAYDIVGLQFVQRHLCRLRPVPLGMFRMLVGTNGEIYEVLWGPSEFYASGLLKDWDIRPRLAELRLPALILSGRHDVATPAQMAVLKQGVAGAEQVMLEASSHLGMWEEPEKYRSALLDFVSRVETTTA